MVVIGDANTDRYCNGAAFRLNGRLELLDDLAGHELGFPRVRHIFQDQDKLIPCHPRHHIVNADGAP